MTVCPTCQQQMPEIRLVVRMPPIKARMFDLIMISGDEGGPAYQLNREIWDGKALMNNIRSHVKQLNDMLEDTGYKIMATNPRFGYRLFKLVNLKEREKEEGTRA